MIMNALIQLMGTLIQLVLPWFYSSCLTFGLRLLTVVFSGIFGWIVGWFFGETFLAIFAQIGITGFSMWQIGAFLGFIGSFLSPIVQQQNKQYEKSKITSAPTH